MNGIEKDEYLCIHKANIDYGVAEAMTTYGIIGIKVWIHHADDSDNTKESHKKMNKNTVSGK